MNFRPADLYTLQHIGNLVADATPGRLLWRVGGSHLALAEEAGANPERPRAAANHFCISWRPGQIDSGWMLDDQAFLPHAYDGSVSMSARSVSWQATL